MKIAVLKRFTVYNELAAGLTEIGAEAMPYDTRDELHSLLVNTNCNNVLDINFHPEIWEECVNAEVNYNVWSFDSAVSGVLRHVDHSRLRLNDRFYLFNSTDCEQARKYHSQVFYLPFSAGPEFCLQPRRKNFRYDVAFVMNSYDDSRQKAEKVYKEQLSTASGDAGKLLILSHELGDMIISRHQQIIDKDRLLSFWQEVTQACGVDPLKGRPQSCRNFLRGLGQLLSASQREICLRELGRTGHEIVVYGDQYWAKIADEYENMTYLGTADYANLPNIYNCARINVNLTQVQNLDSVPQRIFHLLASGGFTLTNGSPALTDLFSPERHLQIFSTWAEMKSMVDYFLKNERERIKIAERGHEEFMSKHQIKDRLATIFVFKPQ